MRITGAPPATTTRHLAALVAMRALIRTGENKATRYRLNVTTEPPVSFEVADIP